MKSFIHSVFIVSVILSRSTIFATTRPPASATVCEEKPVERGTTLYESKEFGFTFEPMGVWLGRQSKNIIIFQPFDSTVPDEKPVPTFQIIVVDAPNLTVANLKDVAKIGKDAHAKKSPDATFSEPEETTIDGVKAIHFTYKKVIQQKEETQGFNYLIINNGRLYAMGFYCRPSQYDRLIESAEKAVKTFKFAK